jgi:hypothetical protein
MLGGSVGRAGMTGSSDWGSRAGSPAGGAVDSPGTAATATEPLPARTLNKGVFTAT